MKKLCAYLIFAFSLSNAHAEPITLLFGGDVTLGRTYQSIAPEARNDPGFSWKNIRHIINTSDMFVINLETAVTSHTIPIPKKFNFSMHKDELSILRSGRVDLVSLANNHSFDYGKKGLFDSLEALDEYGIAYIGAGRSLEEARRAHRTTLKGKRFSFLAYGNMCEHPDAQKYVAYRHTDHVIEDVAREKNEWADHVIVFFHWGVERDLHPRQKEVSLAHAAIDAGADAIIGSHPHVEQPIAWYKNRPIAYSLGNFIFGGNRGGPHTGLLALVTFDDRDIKMQGIPIEINPQTTRYQPRVK